MALCCATLIAACSDDEDATPASDAGEDAAGEDAAAGAGALRVATYNTGLLDSVGYVPTRAPLVTEALADLDVDLLCVQEVWDEAHWEALVDASEDARPHTYRLDPQPGVQGTCTAEELAPALACAEANCAEPGPMGLVMCTTTNCLLEVAVLSTPCVSCLLDNAASGDFDAIEAACVAEGAPASDASGPDARTYVLGGSFGTGILSSLPLTDIDALVLDASSTRRAVLHAKVDAPGLGTLSVFCTHLTADLFGSAYDGSYADWAAENEAQVKALIEWVDEKTDAGDAVIVLGDLNTSPAADGIEAELPDSYAQLPAAGFESPFLDGSSAACTFCPDNTQVMGFDTGVGATLDHVLLRDVDADVTTQRLFTETVEVDEGGDADGGAGSTRLNLSDHYGVAATLTR